MRVGVLFDIKGYSNSAGSCAAEPTPSVRVGVLGGSFSWRCGRAGAYAGWRLYSPHVGLQESHSAREKAKGDFCAVGRAARRRNGCLRMTHTPAF